MVISSFAGRGYARGYVCDQCRCTSSSGHLNGSRERWWCQICSADFCFVCKPKITTSSRTNNGSTGNNAMHSPARSSTRSRVSGSSPRSPNGGPPRNLRTITGSLYDDDLSLSSHGSSYPYVLGPEKLADAEPWGKFQN